MAVQPLSHAELQSIAESCHLHFDDAAMAAMESLVTGALASYDVVDTLAEQDRPSAPERPHTTPQPANKPAERLVRYRRDHRRGQRPAGRQAASDQGQHYGRRAADDERLALP